MMITRIQGSTGTGYTDTPAADPRFGGQQSLHITGEELADGDAMFFRGPHPFGCRLYNLTANECDIVAEIPVRGTYVGIMVSKGGEISNWFQFQVI